ncbi:hypothetical protein [uncultured Maricaulis sp.]|uniref:hypothetical protein n=1 Tax=uncultured Maricaulis sp. TaxID=174710 RepID=UPI0030D9AB12|tara:strand:- start:87621 stop:88052 length:432 start_codon:yes stop_codon:yes gene_type:complete
MRHTIEYDFDNRWALTTFHGPLRISDAVDMLKQTVALPEWTPHWDRIIDYSDGMLGDLDVATVQAAKADLGEVLRAAYGGKPTLSAQVCSDPMRRPLVEYWIGLGAGDYPAGLKLFNSLAQAQAWILASRAARVSPGDQAQPV